MRTTLSGRFHRSSVRRELSIVFDILEGGNAVEGNWEFSFDIPKKITTEFDADADMTINGELLNIETFSLSPLGIILEISENIAPYYRHEDSAFIAYEDGTVV